MSPANPQLSIKMPLKWNLYQKSHKVLLTRCFQISGRYYHTSMGKYAFTAWRLRGNGVTVNNVFPKLYCVIACLCYWTLRLPLLQRKPIRQCANVSGGVRCSGCAVQKKKGKCDAWGPLVMSTRAGGHTCTQGMHAHAPGITLHRLGAE